MLKSITWGEYLLFTTTLVVGWYAVILLGRIIKKPKAKPDVFSAGKRAEMFDEHSQEASPIALSGSENHLPDKTEDVEQDWNLIMQSIMQEVKGIIVRASEENAGPAQLSAQ